MILVFHIIRTYLTRYPFQLNISFLLLLLLLLLTGTFTSKGTIQKEQHNLTDKPTPDTAQTRA